MLKNLPQEKLQQIVDFLIENYDTAPDYLIPKSVKQLLEEDGNSDIFIIEDEYGIEGVTFVKVIREKLAEVYRTVVRMDVRGRGISKQLNSVSENMLRGAGIRKIKCHIFVNNYPSLFRRLKMGYLIEGLLKNHDEPGRHEYILGKEID